MFSKRFIVDKFRNLFFFLMYKVFLPDFNSQTQKAFKLTNEANFHLLSLYHVIGNTRMYLVRIYFKN